MDLDGGESQLLGDLRRLRDVLGRINDPCRQALHHGLGILLTVNLSQLREGLYHQHEAHVIAGKVRHPLREDGNTAGCRELI